MPTSENDPRYRAALDVLHGRGRFGIRLGLGRTRALLRRLGDPQLGLPGVLIGGTNGKGSVQALVAAALHEAGQRVGQTPKPHLVSYRERLVVDGRLIPVAEFTSLVDEVLAVADEVAPRHGQPTEFEILTTAAFCWFRRAKVEVAVVEVGLGGRLDATNVWQGGVSAVTNVALDHTEHLGTTIPQIAREKAAIIKRGDIAAVTGADGAALPVLATRARRVGVPLRVVEPLPVVTMDRGGIVVRTDAGSELRVGLVGRHQADNTAIALAILEALDAARISSVPQRAIERGFANVRWPGRLELLSIEQDGRARPASTEAAIPGSPDVLLDGAHNPHGAAALARALDELRPMLSGGRPTLLIAALADKDVAGIVAALTGSATLAAARVFTTDVPDSPRTLPAAELAQAWDAHVVSTLTDAVPGAPRPPDGAVPIPDAGRALEAALDSSRRSDGPLVVCGSLYLVGFVRGRLIADAPSD